MTLVVNNDQSKLREHFHQTHLNEWGYEPDRKSFGYCSCLIASIKTNNLGQAIEYNLLINGANYDCKALLAERYLFEL